MFRKSSLLLTVLAVAMTLTMLMPASQAAASTSIDGVQPTALVTGDSIPRDLRWKPVIRCSATPTVNDVCWGYVYWTAAGHGGCPTMDSCLYANGIYWVHKPMAAPPASMTTDQKVCLAAIGVTIAGLWLSGGWVAVAITQAGGWGLTIYTCIQS